MCGKITKKLGNIFLNGFMKYFLTRFIRVTGTEVGKAERRDGNMPSSPTRNRRKWKVEDEPTIEMRKGSQ
jgi:hypothetical protein